MYCVALDTARRTQLYCVVALSRRKKLTNQPPYRTHLMYSVHICLSDHLTQQQNLANGLHGNEMEHTASKRQQEDT